MSTGLETRYNQEIKKVRERREAQKAISEWTYAHQHDALLIPGVEQGLSFADFQEKTGCPAALRERYEDLLDERRVAMRQKNDPFLRGFNGQGGIN